MDIWTGKHQMTTEYDSSAENRGVGAIQSLGYIFILCDDIEKMKNFYQNVFQFRLEEEVAGRMIEFRLGGLILGLRSRGRQYDGPKIPNQSAAVQLSFRVPPADVDIAFENLKEIGVDIIEGPTNQDWPHRTLYFKDPENNILEIFADLHTRDVISTPSGAHMLVEQRKEKTGF